jgi:hypothetical protein
MRQRVDTWEHFRRGNAAVRVNYRERRWSSIHWLISADRQDKTSTATVDAKGQVSLGRTRVAERSPEVR